MNPPRYPPFSTRCTHRMGAALGDDSSAAEREALRARQTPDGRLVQTARRPGKRAQLDAAAALSPKHSAQPQLRQRPKAIARGCCAG